MSFETLLYIFFAIAYFIYSMYKASTKVKDQKSKKSIDPTTQPKPYTETPSRARPVEQRKTFRDEEARSLEKPFSYEEDSLKEIAERVNYEKKFAEEEKKALNLKHSAVDFSKRQQIEHPPFDSDQHDQSKITNEIFTEESDEENIASEFDIKKAIIFSEVLNRPKYL